MSLREFIYDIIHVNKPAPVKQPDWVASADMIFQDNTWFWRELEERGKRIYLPQNRKDYVLDTNGDDGDGEVFRMGVEIMEELCRERTVLTTFDAYGPLSQKKHSIPPRSFPERYHCFLQKVHPNVSTYAKNNQELSILSIGFNRDAYFAYAEIREPGPWFEESVSFYRFSENYVPSSAEEAQILAEKHQAELAMYFHAWPDELHFDFDPQNVDVNEIWSVIEWVCKKHNLIVMRPPSDRINFYEHIYDAAYPRRRVTDHDNLELKHCQDVLEAAFLTNDTASLCSVYQCSHPGEEPGTRIWILTPEQFEIWLSKHKTAWGESRKMEN